MAATTEHLALGEFLVSCFLPARPDSRGMHGFRSSVYVIYLQLVGRSTPRARAVLRDPGKTTLVDPLKLVLSFSVPREHHGSSILKKHAARSTNRQGHLILSQETGVQNSDGLRPRSGPDTTRPCGGRAPGSIPGGGTHSPFVQRLGSLVFTQETRVQLSHGPPQLHTFPRGVTGNPPDSDSGDLRSIRGEGAATVA